MATQDSSPGTAVAADGRAGAAAGADAARNAPRRGYTASKQQLLARMRRIEGQVRGLTGMVDDDRYCIDILTQISAVQAALDKVALGLVDGHVRHCMREGAEHGQGEAMSDELMGAVGRLLRHG